MKKLLAIILSITMLLSVGTVAFADGVDGPMQKAKLTVGINAEFFPFEYYDENGNLTGFDIDLMNYIGERIGFEVEYVDMPFDKLIPSVVSGEVDCAISAITATDERKSVVDFTIPYFMVMMVDGSYEDVEEFLIAVSKDKSELLKLINQSITSAENDGTISEIAKKYKLTEVDIDDEAYFLPIIEKSDENAMSGGTPLAPPSDWALSDIEKAEALSITEEGKIYHYRMAITREEFCELIYNYCYNVIREVDTVTGENKFTDTTNTNIIRLNAMGIINGKSETEFAPQDLLTREEAATILNRLINVVHPNLASTELYFEFADSEQISDWSMSAIQRICNMGIMKGVGNNNFAPQDNYTTEQAIVTLVRVLESAGASGLLDENTSIGIIGGADGPTSIIVGDNTINVDKKQEYDNFYVEVKKNTKKVDKFYIDEAIKLTTESGTLASNKDFISYYTSNEETRNKVLAIGAVDYSKPTEVYYMSANREQIINNIKALSGEELDGFDIEKLLKLNRVDFSVIGNLINASYGAENLAALTILTNSRGYVMPKDFNDDFAIYLQYDGEYSALVSFSKFGDGVIKATMSFVNNGERDNIFRRIYEITQGLGEDTIDVSIVK